MQITITNKAPRIVHLPGLPTGDETPASPGPTLAPGENKIDYDHWSKVSGHPVVAGMLVRGELVEGKSPLPASPKGPVAFEQKTEATIASEDESATDTASEGETSPLVDMSAGEAIEIVENEDDLGRLRSYLIGEKRSTVKKAIAARIDEVKAQS